MNKPKLSESKLRAMLMTEFAFRKEFGEVGLFEIERFAATWVVRPSKPQSMSGLCEIALVRAGEQMAETYDLA